MDHFQDQSQSPGGLSLAEILARYFHGQAEIHEAGLATMPGGEVVPHEAAPTLPADPKLAWEESLAILPFYAAKADKKSLKPPPDWPALVWHRGQTQEALASWQAQEENIPVLFNRGMACLFLNKRGNARAFLQKAVDHLPEDGAWHHLGRLYLALAEMRS